MYGVHEYSKCEADAVVGASLNPEDLEKVMVGDNY